MSKIAYIFPGQGAQKPGMGQDFYKEFPVSAEIYDMASEVLGLDMKKLCFTENEQLNQTEYTQAALVTTELAMYMAVKEAFGNPDVTGGLSLGEYSALAVAGVITPEEAVRAVRSRGILMEHEVPDGVGAMSAVLGMEPEAVEDVLSDIEGAEIANYNCPGQIVISGRKTALLEAEKALMLAGARRVIPLNVSGPFHSSMLKGAGEKLGQVLSGITFLDPVIPYTSNVTGAYVTKASEVPELLVTQVSAGVRWQQCIETMLADGVNVFVEIGPGKILSGFLKKINKDAISISLEQAEDLRLVAERLKGIKGA